GSFRNINPNLLIQRFIQTVALFKQRTLDAVRFAILIDLGGHSLVGALGVEVVARRVAQQRVGDADNHDQRDRHHREALDEKYQKGEAHHSDTFQSQMQSMNSRFTLRFGVAGTIQIAPAKLKRLDYSFHCKYWN